MTKPQQRRHDDAIIRKEARDKRTDAEQIKRLNKLDLRAARERSRLLKRMQAGFNSN